MELTQAIEAAIFMAFGYFSYFLLRGAWAAFWDWREQRKPVCVDVTPAGIIDVLKESDAVQPSEP